MIAVSLLSAYLYCPRKIFMERVLKLAEVPREAAVRGTIRHGAYDSLNKTEAGIVSAVKEGMTEDNILELYKKQMAIAIRNLIITHRDSLTRLKLDPCEAFVSVNRSLNIELSIRANNVFSFMQEKGVYGEQLWLELTPKIKSEYKVNSQALRLSGVIDQVLVTPEQLIPVELKTGTAPKEGIWPGHRVQVAAYIMILEDMFNLSLGKGQIRYLDSNDTRDIALNPFMRQEVIDTRIKVEKIISGILLPDKVTAEKKCEKCGLREECFNESMLKERITAISEKEKRVG